MAFGMFQTKEGENIKQLLVKLKQNPSSLELHNQILNTNKSTRERLDNYQEIYKKIEKVWERYNYFRKRFIGCRKNY